MLNNIPGHNHNFVCLHTHTHKQYSLLHNTDNHCEIIMKITYLLTYLLHAADCFLRS